MKPFRFAAFGLILLTFFSSRTIDARAEESTTVSHPTPADNFTLANQKQVELLNLLHNEAQKLLEEKNFQGALDAYQKAVLIEPDDEVAYTNTGRIYMILGDTGRAKDAFENALNINPDNKMAAFGLRRIQDPDSPLEPENPDENDG